MLHTCERCGYNTRRKWTFDNHINRRNQCVIIKQSEILNLDDNSKAIRLTCQTCHKIMSTSKALIKHQETCSLQCPICEKSFSDKSAKSRHIKTIFCKKPPTTSEINTLTTKSQYEIIQYLTKINKLKDEKIDMKDKEIEMKHKEIEAKDEEIENLITLAFEDEHNPRKMKPKPKRSFVTQITKAQIAASQKWCCRICTTLFTGIYHMDHTIPLSFGGEDNRENVTALCVQCHAEKSQNEWKERADMKHLTVESLQT